MKKELKILSFILSFATFTMPASASFLSLWDNEDEEAFIIPKEKNYSENTKISSNDSSSSMWNLWKDEDEEAQIMPENNEYSNAINEKQYNKNIYTNNNRISYPQSVKNDIKFSNKDFQKIDYDTLQSERNIGESEIVNSINKWKNGIVSVFWENYRGNNVRIEMLRNNRDLKEMRLKFVQSQNMTSDPDGSISDMLNVVANQVMRRTCGKKAKQSIILYERPSVELEKETAADGYKIMAKGTSLKEYGFRCIY